MEVRARTWPRDPGWWRVWWTEVDLEQGSQVEMEGWERGREEPDVGMVDWDWERCRTGGGSGLWRVWGLLCSASCF